MRLVEYPYVVVRLACSHCPRAGRYRLARLAAAHGAEIDMMELARTLAAGCPRLEPPVITSVYPCGVHYPDLASGRPPDRPAGRGLLVVPGGRAA